MTEQALLRMIRECPSDSTPILVYADWLDEQGGECITKAKYLRLIARGAGEKASSRARRSYRRQVQQLAVGLDAEWLAVVSRLSIENCSLARLQYEPKGRLPLSFEFVCDRGWESLRTTPDVKVRYCDGCQKTVHYCVTIEMAREHALAGHCIAVGLGVTRSDGDLQTSGMFMTLGVPARMPVDGLRYGLESDVERLGNTEQQRGNLTNQ